MDNPVFPDVTDFPVPLDTLESPDRMDLTACLVFLDSRVSSVSRASLASTDASVTPELMDVTEFLVPLAFKEMLVSMERRETVEKVDMMDCPVCLELPVSPVTLVTTARTVSSDSLD